MVEMQRRGRLAENAYTYTKELIFDGMQSGQKIRVEDVVNALRTSRQPVMDAFKRLASEGFLEIIPQVGCRVVTVESRDVADFFSLFAAVEGTVCALAARRRTQAELETLANLTQQLEAFPEGRERRSLDRAFHAQIHAMAHSPVSAAIAGSLWDRSEFFAGLLHGDGSPTRSGHAGVVAAIATGNDYAADLAMRDHIIYSMSFPA
ncbi:MAG: GntR family transcriptional regulator [Candidatus Velthaea sp.]|jgi:DNA-binding GntR family transcriptional regulator